MGAAWCAAALLLCGCDVGPVDTIARGMMNDTSEARVLSDAKAAMDARLLVATAAGLAEAKQRGIDTSDEVPAAPYLADGTLHPTVKRWAMDGDGALRGSGPSMTYLEKDAAFANDLFQSKLVSQRRLVGGGVGALLSVIGLAVIVVWAARKKAPARAA